MNQKRGSVYKVFCIIKGCIEIFENNKDFIGQFKPLSKIWFQRQPKFLVKIYQKIYNEIENGFYSYKDLTIAIIFLYYFIDKFNYLLFNDSKTAKMINNIIEQLSDTQYEKDKKLLLEFQKKAKITNYLDYFKLQEDGKNIIYRLIKSHKISPIVFIKEMENYIKILEENKEKQDYRFIQFLKISKTLKTLIEK